MDPTRYRGRFAPSPTGPLHFGSLVTAVASFLDARSNVGEWRLRIEDLDRARSTAGAVDQILRSLDAFGFEWDGDILYQSRRVDAYAEALDRLRESGSVFPCACTRRELADAALAPDGAAIYPGTCRAGLPPGARPRAERLRVESGEIAFVDAVQGTIVQNLAREVGDFVVKRADGVFAYHLAVVVDDAEQAVSHVVRGADLMFSTPRQILLQQLLGLETPAYSHLPVAVNAAGEKLSKQTAAAGLDLEQRIPLLLAALNFLGQAPPAELAAGSLADLWRWAVGHWQLARVARRLTLPEPQ